jgi:hypothetical protein
VLDGEWLVTLDPQHSNTLIAKLRQHTPSKLSAKLGG